MISLPWDENDIMLVSSHDNQPPNQQYHRQNRNLGKEDLGCLGWRLIAAARLTRISPESGLDVSHAGSQQSSHGTITSPTYYRFERVRTP